MGSACGDLSTEEAPEFYHLMAFEGWPKEQEAEIVWRVERFKDWPIHRTDLYMSRIVELTPAANVDAQAGGGEVGFPAH